jgi:hypothetical protein
MPMTSKRRGEIDFFPSKSRTGIKEGQRVQRSTRSQPSIVDPTSKWLSYSAKMPTHGTSILSYQGD